MRLLSRSIIMCAPRGAGLYYYIRGPHRHQGFICVYKINETRRRAVVLIVT